MFVKDSDHFPLCGDIDSYETERRLYEAAFPPRGIPSTAMSESNILDRGNPPFLVRQRQGLGFSCTALQGISSTAKLAYDSNVAHSSRHLRFFSWNAGNINLFPRATPSYNYCHMAHTTSPPYRKPTLHDYKHDVHNKLSQYG